MPPKPPIRIPAKPGNPVPTHIARPPPFQLKSNASRTSRNGSIPQATPQSPTTNTFSGKGIARFGVYMAVGLSGLIWVRDHYIDYTYVRGSSMAPTLNAAYHETGEKDLVVMQPYGGEGARGEDADLKRGDIVTFWKPRNPRELGIKRIVAVEGDSVWVKSGYAVDAGEKERLKGMPDGLQDFDEDSIASMRNSERGKVVVPYGHVLARGG